MRELKGRNKERGRQAERNMGKDEKRGREIEERNKKKGKKAGRKR